MKLHEKFLVGFAIFFTVIGILNTSFFLGNQTKNFIIWKNDVNTAIQRTDVLWADKVFKFDTEELTQDQVFICESSVTNEPLITKDSQ